MIRATSLRPALARAAALALALAAPACARRPAPPADLAAVAWDSVLARARGTTVTWRMWRGDPSVNAFVDGWVTPRLAERHGITLRAIEGQGPEIVNQLLVERDARAAGSADLVWINGETFGNLRAAGLLAGPWAHRLPHARYVDSSDAILLRDFERPIDGWESPWGRVQFALIYDTARTPAPPRSVAELADWIDAHPGRFTHDQQFTGVAFLKILLFALNGGVGRFAGGFDSAAYAAGSERVWQWLEARRPNLWRGGAAYPPGVADLHRLFANGEVDFSMSYNQHEVLTKVRQGILPPTARALLLEDGTLANAHFLGIPASAPNPWGAMVVADFLLSPEAQLEKLRPEVWADGTVLARDRLPAEWSARFDALGRDPLALPPESLAARARPEVDAAYHERLAADWRRRLREAR